MYVIKSFNRCKRKHRQRERERERWLLNGCLKCEIRIMNVYKNRINPRGGNYIYYMFIIPTPEYHTTHSQDLQWTHPNINLISNWFQHYKNRIFNYYSWIHCQKKNNYPFFEEILSLISSFRYLIVWLRFESILVFLVSSKRLHQFFNLKKTINGFSAAAAAAAESRDVFWRAYIRTSYWRICSSVTL